MQVGGPDTPRSVDRDEHPRPDTTFDKLSTLRPAFARDGTVTAVIEIQYQGPSASFSWLLPISSVPTGESIAVASNAAFQRLQSATNPQYQLTTRVEGTCDESGPNPRGGVALGGDNQAVPGSSSDGGVTVAASGAVGPFEWTALELDPALDVPGRGSVETLLAGLD